MSSAGNMDLASCTLVSEAMNFSAALRTSSVETPVGLISNKPGITFPFVVIPSKGAARPSCSFCSDIWRKRSANAKAGCHVPLNLNQLDDGYLILKDDEVFCGSDWIPLLKSETMIGDNKMKTEYEQPTQFVVATSCPVLPGRPARFLCRLQPRTIAARRRHRPTHCQALFPQGQGHLRGQERRHRQHR